MAQLTDTLTLTRCGEHWMDGGLYKDVNGNYYVDHFCPVESGQVNTVDILCPRHDPSGEPDYSLTGIIELTNPPTERERKIRAHHLTINRLWRLKFDVEGFCSEGDCRYHRPDCLWAGNVMGQIAEMRQQYAQLPDDIKDASPLSGEAIAYYADYLQTWALEEFARPEYDPVPRTKLTDPPSEILLAETLYYRDDDGKLQHPTHLWFTSDSRRWHLDQRCTHGKAMTSYLGKHGTTLTSVFYLDGGLHPILRRPDLCDVSCRVGKDGWRTKLYDWYYD